VSEYLVFTTNWGQQKKLKLFTNKEIIIKMYVQLKYVACINCKVVDECNYHFSITDPE